MVWEPTTGDALRVHVGSVVFTAQLVPLVQHGKKGIAFILCCHHTHTTLALELKP